MYSLELLGKHSSKEGSRRKSGALGSAVCFRCLLLSLLVDGGSKVSVALGTRKAGAYTSFRLIFTSIPCKEELLGNFEEGERLLLLQIADAKLVCKDAIF